jgi:hypothetical protein
MQRAAMRSFLPIVCWHQHGLQLLLWVQVPPWERNLDAKRNSRERKQDFSLSLSLSLVFLQRLQRENGLNLQLVETLGLRSEKFKSWGPLTNSGVQLGNDNEAAQQT